MKLFDGVDATVILSMVECCYAVVEVSVSGMECCECIVDLEGDVMLPWKIKGGLIGLVVGLGVGRLRI